MFMVPHGPVTKSQSGIMPNVAHNDLGNAFSQLINPLSAFYFAVFRQRFTPSAPPGEHFELQSAYN